MSQLNEIELHNGVIVPEFGFDAEHIEKDQALDAVKTALHSGYRYLSISFNRSMEHSAADAIRNSGLYPSELFLAGIIEPGRDDKAGVIHDIQISLRLLEMNQIDLLMLRSPDRDASHMMEAWHGLEELYKRGIVKAIGIDCMGSTDIENLLQQAEISPMIGRIELYPGAHYEEELAVAGDHRISAEGCLPRHTEQVKQLPAIRALAAKYSVSENEILLQYMKSKKVIVLWPDPVMPKDNFRLTDEELKVLNYLKLNQQ